MAIKNEEYQSSKESIGEKEQLSEKESLFERESVTEKESVKEKELLKDSEARDKKGDEKSPDDQEAQKQIQEQATKSGNGLGTIGGTVAVAAVAVVIVVTSLITSISAVFNKLEVSGRSLDYEVAVTLEMEKSDEVKIDLDNMDAGMYLLVFNNDGAKTVPLITGSEYCDYSYKVLSEDDKAMKVEVVYNGTVSGLESGVRYRVQVVTENDGAFKVYAEQTVKTIQLTSEIRGIETECKCMIDGNFYFTLNFLDENEYYSNFTYEVIDSKGNVVRSGEMTEPHERQTVEKVDELNGKDFKLVIHFNSTADSDVLSSGGKPTLEYNVEF